MKNVKGSFKTLALLACGVLFLSLLGGHAVAAKRPQPPALWPQGAALDVVGSYRGYVMVIWPLATGVDHYRVKVAVKHPNWWVILDESPASYEIASSGEALWSWDYGQPATFRITVTAYSGPDEATAYSESLQTTFTSPVPDGIGF